MTRQTEGLKTILEKLVTIPSVTRDAQQARAVIAAARDIATAYKPAYVREGEHEGFPYLIAGTRPPDTQTIWFVCHLDVVPAEKHMFAVTEDEDNYYGRGVFDMKGMTSAILRAFTRLSPPEDYNVCLLFTTDEEIGGKRGAGKVVPEIAGNAAAAFVLDQAGDWVLLEKMKGVLRLEIESKGLTAHGARPWLGKSANSQLVNYLHEFSRWFENTITAKRDNDLYYTTHNLGLLSGGEAANQVSASASATLDIRFTDEATASAIISGARKLAKKYEDIVVHETTHEPSYEADPNNPWHQKAQAVIKELGFTPGDPVNRFGHGSTDGRYFAPYGVPVISTRPAGGGMHAPDEWVSKQGLHDLEAFCLKLMRATRMEGGS